MVCNVQRRYNGIVKKYSEKHLPSGRCFFVVEAHHQRNSTVHRGKPSNTFTSLWGGGSAAAYGDRIKEGARYMLTAKQETFAQNIVSGMNQADAYRSAYPNQRMTDKTIWETASKLIKNPKVIARIQELRAQLAKPTIMSAQERLEWLTALIKSEEETTSDKLKAADIMNKMQGEYVQKIEADVKSEVNICIELSDD